MGLTGFIRETGRRCGRQAGSCGLDQMDGAREGNEHFSVQLTGEHQHDHDHEHEHEHVNSGFIDGGIALIVASLTAGWGWFLIVMLCNV